jgi:hypothetical protein
MPNWNHTDRGTNRVDDESEFATDYDGLSDMEYRNPVGRGRAIGEYGFGRGGSPVVTD